MSFYNIVYMDHLVYRYADEIKRLQRPPYDLSLTDSSDIMKQIFTQP